MNSTASRIGALGSVFGIGFLCVLGHLWFVMVQDREVWARRSHENRWSFRAVPSQRGQLLDRHGRVLASDAPTMQLALHYQRFRLRHPVGAAVHGAIVWAGQQPGRAGTSYDYGTGALGPEAAVRDLLAMPAGLLRPRALPKPVTAELQTTVTTVLAQLSGLSRAKVFAAVREAARSNPGQRVGDVLERPRAWLLDTFDQRVRELRELDAELRAQHRQRLAAAGIVDEDPPGLLGTLERMRLASLADEHVTWQENGETRQGSALETVRTTFAEHVPFPIAARLRIAADRHAGFEVEPSVARETAVAEGSALRALLGKVALLDRALPDTGWLLQHFGSELPSEWLDDFVPEGIADGDGGRASWQDDASDRYLRELRRRERRGTSGLEAAFDEPLSGRLGMRFIETDSKRREHRLWGNLQVEAGRDVRVTLDLQLQRFAEQASERAFETFRQGHAEPARQKKVEAALAVIDARTGDILAYGGAPIVSPKAADVPGVVWVGNGAIGSVVKPMVLIEQLQAEALGRPHRPLASLQGCNKVFHYGGTTIECGHAHWDAGRDPVQALAASCNLFYFQVGVGLGDDGLARALRRFGLMAPAPDGGDPFGDRWQPSVRGLAVAAPTVDAPRTDADGRVRPGELLPRRAIGYGIQCSPLHLARAYAVFATGALPRLRMLAGEPVAAVPFADVAAEIEVVRDGLRACVTRGTADGLPLLQELAVLGKTGTAEVSERDDNNAWFAGFLPGPSSDGVQLCFCAVVYFVADQVHGGDAAGQVVVDFLEQVRADPELARRYLPAGDGR
jgi:cell division protein FtsI/penicillin-binding protein 2